MREELLAEVRKLFSADSPVVNAARADIEATVSDMLDLSGLDTSDAVPAEGIALEAKARKLAAKKLEEVFTRLGLFDGSKGVRGGQKKLFN